MPIDMPNSLAIPTARMFVPEPMVVVMPPSNTAMPIGSKTFDGALPARSEQATSTGISMTICGVSLMKPLVAQEVTSVTNSANRGRCIQVRASTVTTGCMAPVRSSPLPEHHQRTDGNQSLVTEVGEDIRRPEVIVGIEIKDQASASNTHRLVASARICSRENRYSAAQVRPMTTKACRSGKAGKGWSPVLLYFA
jgi:hypothetical protein